MEKAPVAMMDETIMYAVMIIFICRLGAGIPAPKDPLPCEERVRIESENVRELRSS
jgi:hypothetical protein